MLTSFDSQPSTDASRLEAEQFVQSAMDALSAHIAVLDEDGVIIGVNAAWHEYAQANGYRGSDHGIGLNYLSVCDHSDRLNFPDAGAVGDGIRSVISGQMTEFSLEYPCHSPSDRRWFVVRVSRFVFYGQLRLIVAHQNVSELKRAQIELIEGNQRLKAVLDNINNAILTITIKGEIASVNPAAISIFACEDPGDMVGQSFSRFLVQSGGEPLDLSQLSGDAGHEILGRRLNDELFPIMVTVNRLHAGGRDFYTCIVQDITTRRRMEAEIIERERMQIALEKERELRKLRNRFLSMMSHELRTPLTSINLSYDMLRKYGDVSTPEERNQALDNIHIQVSHLSEMVQDVMVLSRGETDGFGLDLQSVDLITYCRDIVEEFQFTYHKTHQIEFASQERDLQAVVDPKLLRRALTNLLSNAVKYSPDGGQVDFLLARSQNDQIEIRVVDCGIGIPIHDQEQLFEPFHRAENVDSLPGTGLGLAISKQAIEQHNGWISFISAPGQGTTFIVRLPRVASALE